MVTLTEIWLRIIMLSEAMPSFLMVVLSPGAQRNKKPSPYPRQRVNRSQLHMWQKKHCGWGPSLIKSSDQSPDLPPYFLITNVLSCSPKSIAIMLGPSTLISIIIYLLDHWRRFYLSYLLSNWWYGHTHSRRLFHLWRSSTLHWSSGSHQFEGGVLNNKPMRTR